MKQQIDCRFPFDYKNPFGYLIGFALIYVGVIYSLTVLLCQTTFIIASYWMLMSLAKDTTNELNSINAATKNRLELTKRFSDAIQLHSNAKQLSHLLLARSLFLHKDFLLICTSFRFVSDLLETF